MSRARTIRRMAVAAQTRLSERFDRDREAPITRRRWLGLALGVALIFTVALGVRLLHQQDIRVETAEGQSLLTAFVRPYRQEARRMLDDGSILFPNAEHDPRDARMIVHPPGYSILLRAFYPGGSSGDSYSGLRLFQIIVDAACAVLVFLIALEIVPFAAALIAALLVAVSPHLAHYSLWLTPESLAVAPILIAVYLVARAARRPHLGLLLAAGGLIGLSCWLRSNALLLAPFLSMAVFLLFEKGKRLRYSLAVIAAAVFAISPITIRNWVVYGKLVPLSLGAGITLIEGIAEYDRDGRFGLPATDKEAVHKDAEWHNKREYASNPWSPDGIERDRARFARGLNVIRSNPGWFLGVMLDRAWAMLRYNDSLGHGRHYHIAAVPVIAAEPPPGHSAPISEEAEPAWSVSGVELLAEGELLSQAARATIAEDGQALRIAGDLSDFGDQFTSPLIPVEKETDYLMTFSAVVEEGQVSAKVTSEDREVALAAVTPSEAEEKDSSDSLEDGPERSTEMIFASGDREAARLVFANNGLAPPRPVLNVYGARLFKLGLTPSLWTRYPRALIRGLQRNLFKTELMVGLIAAGIALLALLRRKAALVLLLAIPLYYLCFQSLLHTEYRYTIGMHYFLFVFAGCTLYLLGLFLLRLMPRRG